MAGISQTSPDVTNDNSKDSLNELGYPQSGLRGLEGDAKEIENAKDAQMDNSINLHLKKMEDKANEILAQLEGLTQLEIKHILNVVKHSLPTLFHLSPLLKPPE